MSTEPVAPPKAVVSTKQWALFFKGFCGAFFGTLGWQFFVGILAVLLASSHVLSKHTRYQEKLAVALLIIGLGLNVWVLCWVFRRAQPRVKHGISAGCWLLVLLALAITWLISITQGLADLD